MLTAVVFAVAEGEAHNPILPEINEVIWGAISFTVLFYLLAKFGFPAVKKGMDARADRIRDNLADAERAREEAQAALADYKRRLAEANDEAGRIIDEARKTAETVRADLRARAEAEAAEIRQRASDDIAAQVVRAQADLRARVALMSIELAEKVVEHNLDRDTNQALVEQYITQLGSSSN